MPSFSSWVVALGATILIAACARMPSEAPRTVHPGFKAGALPTSGRVLLMPLDVELYEVQAGGMVEPQAAWTRAAKTHVKDATEARLKSKGSQLVPYAPPAEGSTDAHVHQQLIKLHEAVSSNILKFRNLPTTRNRFDWSLGKDAALLRAGSGADYALFIVIRDSYTSEGRKALQVLGALLGIGIPGGVQLGFASLVDLKSGDIVWYNLLGRGEGDLRTPGPARAAVAALLAEFPL